MPMEEAEMNYLADQYLPLLDPEFTKLVLDAKGQPAAFIVSSPDISKGIIKAKGRLWPFGFIHILVEAGRSRQLDLFLGAVRNNFQNHGLTAILGAALFRTAIKRKMEFMDSHLILESNIRMRAIMERLGAEIYKRYRIYSKKIST
jgi:hypothetical protein